MKILQCPNCHGIVVSEVNVMSNRELLKCSNCGYTDYMYTFGFAEGRKNLDFCHGRMMEVITAIRSIIDEGIDNYSTNELIYDINKQCPFLSPIIISYLINAILDSKESSNERYNDGMFVEYIYEKVSLEKLLQYNSQISSVACLRNSMDEESNSDIRMLQARCKDLERQLRDWKKDYSLLSEKWQKLQEENESLKMRLKI